MKKAVSFLLSLLLMVSIASCSAPKAGDSDQASSTEQPSLTVETSSPEVSRAPAPTPWPIPTPAPSKEASVTVYITETGSKYHSAGCQYLKKSCIPMDLDDAKRSYDPCSKCHPPR